MCQLILDILNCQRQRVLQSIRVSPSQNAGFLWIPIVSHRAVFERVSFSSFVSHYAKESCVASAPLPANDPLNICPYRGITPWNFLHCFARFCVPVIRPPIDEERRREEERDGRLQKCNNRGEREKGWEGGKGEKLVKNSKIPCGRLTRQRAAAR